MEDINIKEAQARTAGFAQALINRGVPEDAVVKLAYAYMEPTNGMFQKRANSVRTFLGNVATCVEAYRSGRALS